MVIIANRSICFRFVSFACMLKHGNDTNLETYSGKCIKKGGPVSVCVKSCKGEILHLQSPKRIDFYENTLSKYSKILLILILQVLGERVLVTSGITDDVLELPIKTKLGKIFDKKTAIYLYPEKKKIPVPKIIYKIVKYRLNNCTSNSRCWLSAIIIIHNDPSYDNTSDNRLCDDVTSRWGWNAITEDPNGQKFNNIYVCGQQMQILTKLLGRMSASRERERSAFNLENLPVFEGDDTSVTYVYDVLFLELKKLDGNGMIRNLEKGEITVRKQNRDQEDDEINESEVDITASEQKIFSN